MGERELEYETRWECAQRSITQKIINKTQLTKQQQAQNIRQDELPHTHTRAQTITNDTASNND